MKAAIVMPLGEQRGGAELTLWHVLERGRSLGIDWLAVFLEDGSLVDRTRGLGVEVEVVPARRMRHLHRSALSALRIASLARREEVDVIIGWMAKGQLYAGAAALLGRVPCLWFQAWIPEPNWLDRLATLLPARGVVTCSRASDEAQRRLRPRRPTRVVYPGVELRDFDPAALPTPPEARRRLGLPGDGPLVGTVGRLQRWKGMHVLVEAMPRILEAHSDAHCVVVGGDDDREPGYRAYLERRVEQLGLHDRVRLVGLQGNVAEWMQAMDVVVHASANEPFGMVVIEAMALGKPVVAGDSGGPKEVITHGVDGTLAPHGDSEALALAVLRFLDDPTFSASAGRAARERASGFSADACAREMVASIRQLCMSPTVRT